MELTTEHVIKVLDIVREYRATRDVMTSPFNTARASHMQFISFCNERALTLHRVLPVVTFDEVMALYKQASGMVPGFQASRLWSDFKKEDEVALTELLGVLLGILRQQRA